MNRFLNLLNLVPPEDDVTPPPAAPASPTSNTFRNFEKLAPEVQLEIWKQVFPGFGRVDRMLPSPDPTSNAFDTRLFVQDPYNTNHRYATTKPNLISVGIKFLPIFVDRQPLQGAFVLGRPYSKRRIDLKFSMFMPNPDPARYMRQINKTANEFYHRYKPRFLQLRAGGPKIFFNPERDFVEMDEISLFLLWYYGHVETPVNSPTEIAGFDEIRFLQLGNPTYRFPQGFPPRIEFRGIGFLRRNGRRLLRSVVFPEDQNPNVVRGPILLGSTPYSNAMKKILSYMSGHSDSDPRYHNFPPRYRLIWEEVVNSRQFAMTDKLLLFYS